MAATALRTRVRSVWQPSFRRTLYTKRAQFTRPNESGAPMTKEVSVWMGDPDEAYVIVPRDVGKAFVQAKHLSPAEGELRLKFDHHTRRFLCRSESRLQLEIPQQMPFKSTYASNTGISDAILFHTPWSPTHTIAIENTPDCKSLFIPWRRGIPLLLTPVQIGLQDERLKATVY
ncbi:hypothetical protein DIS24_g10269 [Lasiodiplodia hormozganensis]|uniref:Uncharacterized protein n=1 Tax=Lasiodiplodia hormozganensis TaxID=869390 RepID=A0AA39XQL6_9PEZI|nr:hypothetical protein DIS24_g10269 [Lasiodiplodia hormozganensis]